MQYNEGAMRRSSCLWLALGGLLVIACSSSSAPPTLGECTGNGEGGCPAGSSGGGGGSSGSGGDDSGADSGACQVSSAQSQCDQCAGTACCSELDDCGTSVPCENVLTCYDACTTASCQQNCPQQYPGTGATLFNSLEQCISQKCPVCAQLGTGDPCWDTTVQCNAGLSCIDLWCTKTCTNSSQCTGLGANGGNFTGHAPNACRRIASGSWCFPGCASDADCTDFPGTYCVQTTDITGASVAVCQAGPDGGLE